jgi:peptidyl-prolyl cis-trans isomerase-like protein 2
MCLCVVWQPKHWVDLMSGEKFTKSDIITIQDPHDINSRDIQKFSYVQLVADGAIAPPVNAAAAAVSNNDSATASAAGAAATDVNANASSALKRVLTEVADPAAAAAAAAKAKAEREAKKAAEFTGKRLPKAGAVAAAAADTKTEEAKKVPEKPKHMYASHSTGAAAGKPYTLINTLLSTHHLPLP